jgi:hypothetical protein
MLLARLLVRLFVRRQKREATGGAAIRLVSVLGIGIRNAAGEAEGTGAAEAPACLGRCVYAAWRRHWR